METKSQKRRTDEGSGRKTEVVSIRLDPKLKYLAELCARKQRRTLSSFIEWAVERSLSEVMIEEDWQGEELSIADAEKKHRLWDVDEPDRFVRLAIKYPDLLTFDEQILWKEMRHSCDIDALIKRHRSPPIVGSERNWPFISISREDWERIRAKAQEIKLTLGHRKSAHPSDGNSKQKS